MLTIKLTNTSAGLIAIQRALAGEDITFTKLDIGDGVLTNLDISNFTGVINKIKDYSLGVVKPEGQEMVRLRANINNVGITEDKAIREFGLYAKFGSSEQEFLFAYMNTGDIPTALPSSSGGRYDLNRDFVLYIGSSTNVTFDTNGDLVYSTLNDYKALEAQKEDKFPKNSAFNRDFGVNENQVLEGSKLAEILGIEYGGILNNSNQKISGKGYYDTANKKIYKCTGNTSINYADAGYFIEVSNNDLLGKLQNLVEIGSNSNGTYRKWADGTLECWASEKRAAITPSYSTFNFPYQFKYSGRTSVVCSATDVGDGAYSYGCAAISGTQYRLYGEKPTVGTESGMAHLYFKGVWK